MRLTFMPIAFLSYDHSVRSFDHFLDVNPTLRKLLESPAIEFGNRFAGDTPS
jgi:hypothetical protein